MNDQKSLGSIKQALRGHATFRFIALLLGFGFQVIVAKTLPPESYATYAILLATLLVGERLLSFGTDRTVLRFVPALILRKDRTGLRLLAIRLGVLRATGLILFVLAWASISASHVRLTPSELSTTTTVAFGIWFVAYTLLKEGDAVAQSLIAHHWAALVAACEVGLRLGLVSFAYFFFRSVDVEMVAIVYAVTSSTAVAALLGSIWVANRLQHVSASDSVSSRNEVAVDVQHQTPAFATAAYTSTLSYLISSPGVVRLVARTGLNIYALAAFSFVQGLATSLSGALPGQLILPSLESVAASLADRGSKERILPALSLLFKVELICVLAVIITAEIAGGELIRILSRPVYAPYYYILPILMVGVSLHTIYRMLEIIGSMNLKYRVFTTLWPLSAIAMVALYLTIGRWGLISVLVVPLLEIIARVAILVVVFRRDGIWNALDPARSMRLVLSAMVVLLGSSYVLREYGQDLGKAVVVVAIGGVTVFLATLLIVRPLNALECKTLSAVLPTSWRLPKYIARRLSSP
jgi:O-antigen/teichoic acid export membrane protein